jgi:hypothetical protein
LSECQGRYRIKIGSYYYDREYEPGVFFVFVSGFSSGLAKIGSIYNKYILIVTPEILESLDIKYRMGGRWKDNK